MLPRILGCLRAAAAALPQAAARANVIATGNSILPRTSGAAPTALAAAAAAGGARILPRVQVRFATHKASSASNSAKDGPGKRLGAKKTGGEPVKVGMIIYRQRGTLWFPGENAAMGRDHTIYAAAPGFVRYYRDAAQPKRKFIGVALSAAQQLPTPPNARRRRLLGRVEVPLREPPPPVPRGSPIRLDDLKTSDGFYVYRPANWRIGRTMPPVDVRNNDPFARWRKRARREKNWKLKRGIR